VPEDGVRSLSARLARQGHAAITAVQFLTRLPLPGGMNQPPSDRTLLVDAVAYFPLVGALIGLVTGWLVWAAATVWPIGLAVVLAVAVEAVLTGAFHEDAVADCCDAFGGGWTREQVLHILKDSRVGSFGVLGLGLALAVRVGGDRRPGRRGAGGRRDGLGCSGAVGHRLAHVAGAAGARA
jgi:cobalamin synthase